MNSLGKRASIAAAVTTMLASKASFALPPSIAPQFTLYAAGSSNQANAFYAAASTFMTELDSYTDDTNGGADSVNYRVLYGVGGASFNGISYGGDVLIFYKIVGDDFLNGIAPQIGRGTTLAYPTVASVLAATTLAATTGIGVPTYQYLDNGQLTNFQVPDWGVADVEVALFSGFNNPVGPPSNPGGTAQNTDGGAAPVPSLGGVANLYDNVFGIAATHNLFAGTHPKTNFSKAEVEGILTGNLSDWSQIAGDDGKPLPPGGIVFLDTGEGSGTKVAGNQYFLGYPGNGIAEILPFSAQNPYSGTSLGSIASEQSLDIAETSATAIVRDLIRAQGRNIRAIAVLGMENPPYLHQTNGINTYDFVKINGIGVDTGTPGDDINGTVATSYVNVVTGNYDFFYQNSFNTRTNFLDGTSPGAVFANEFKQVMSAPTIAAANSGKKFPAAVPGTLVDAFNVSAVTNGVTLDTRSRVSTAVLQSHFNVPPGGIPKSSEPLH